MTPGPLATTGSTGTARESFPRGFDLRATSRCSTCWSICRSRPALRRALGLLEPTGLLVATVPAFSVLWTSHDEFNHHVTRYTRETFGRLAASAGLRIESSRYLFHWTWPVKLVQRLAERVLPHGSGPPQVPPDWLNRGLLALCRTEYRLLSGLPMPFGTSLFVVGTNSHL